MARHGRTRTRTRHGTPATLLAPRVRAPYRRGHCGTSAGMRSSASSSLTRSVAVPSPATPVPRAALSRCAMRRQECGRMGSTLLPSLPRLRLGRMGTFVGAQRRRPQRAGPVTAGHGGLSAGHGGSRRLRAAPAICDVCDAAPPRERANAHRTSAPVGRQPRRSRGGIPQITNRHRRGQTVTGSLGAADAKPTATPLRTGALRAESIADSRPALRDTGRRKRSLGAGDRPLRFHRSLGLGRPEPFARVGSRAPTNVGGGEGGGLSRLNTRAGPGSGSIVRKAA